MAETRGREEAPVLGILMIDSVATFLPGGTASASSYGVPVKYLRIPGATGNRVIGGDPGLTASFVEGAQELVRRGAEAISSNCGFVALYQPAIAAAVRVPVFVSSLLQVPFVAATLAPGQRVGILTYDAAQLSRRHFEACGWDPDRIKIAVAGVRDLPEWAVLAAPEAEIDPDAMRDDLVSVADQLLASTENIGALVLECTAMCPFAPDLQARLGLPVFDLNSLIHTMLRVIRYPRYSSTVPPPPEAGISLSRIRGTVTEGAPIR